MAKKNNKITASVPELFKGRQDSMYRELLTIRKSVSHAPSMGDVGENKWRKFLSDYLPKRYQVEKAFVVSSKGEISDHVDVIIFDRQYSHFVFNHDGLIYVPAESVYAAFELKQNIDKTNLNYTSGKIESVRSLFRTSVAVPQIDGKMKRKTPARILGGLIALESDYKEPFNKIFRRNLSSLKGIKKIDMIYSLKDGLFKAKYEGDGLLLFLSNLMIELQKMGNPPAIDYKKYSFE